MLLGAEFAPVFTHQIFSEEQQHLDTNDDVDDDDTATKIDVHLKPSCKECFFVVQNRIDDDDGDDAVEQNAKRLKTTNDNEDSTDRQSTKTIKDAADLRSWMQRFLPPFVTESAEKAESSCSNCDGEGYLTELMGTVHHEYMQGDRTFCISLCEGNKCAEYHDAVQKLAYYFIETAEDVNVGSEDAKWKCLYLFQQHTVDNGTTQQHRYSLAGYMTLYHFHSPFRKPKAGVIVRVCQVLILPPYQRAGHGKALLEAAFSIAAQQQQQEPTVVELNCEDPAPSFQQLRTLVDYNQFVRDGRQWSFLAATTTTTPTDDAFFTPLRDAMAQQCTTVHTLTTAKQIQLVHEIEVLRRLREFLSATTATTASEQRDALETKYRLMVKQRLHRQHQEELGTYPTKEERQRRLGELFDESLHMYERVLRHHGHST